MEGRLAARVKAFAEELAQEHQAELAAAGRLVDLEELTCQIGDAVTRLLWEQELVRRAGAAAGAGRLSRLRTALPGGPGA